MSGRNAPVLIYPFLLLLLDTNSTVPRFFVYISSKNLEMKFAIFLLIDSSQKALLSPLLNFSQSPKVSYPDQKINVYIFYSFSKLTLKMVRNEGQSYRPKKD